MATSFSHNTASGHAVELLKAALESGIIKLQGPQHMSRSPADQGKADAEYLAALVNQLADSIKSPNQ